MSETLAEAMTRVKGATDLAAYCDAHLERRGRGWYVCPVCGSGNNRGEGRGTAAFHTYKSRSGETRWHCSATCNSDGDIYDLAGILEKTEDRAEQCNAVAAWAGIEGWHRDGGAVDRGEAIGWNGTATVTDQQPTADGQGEKAEQPTDYTEFYEKAHADLMADPEALAYLHGRGLTDETIERHNLGYVADWTHPKDGRHHTKRIIMPRTASTYTARAFDETERDYNPEYKKQIVGSQLDIFNLKAARGAEVVVVVEGELDAASVTQATGYVAVGLGSTSNAASFPAKAKKAAPNALWLISLDNDHAKPDGSNPGQDAQKRLMDGMRECGLAVVAVDGARMYGQAKDANEALTTDPTTLKVALDEAAEQPWRNVMASYDVVDATEAVRDLYELRDGREPIATGLEMLDNVTGGGLHAKSLHVVGAQSSEGKTTVTLQVGDHVAASGHPVLFVSIEQRTSELVAKSLSRIAYTSSHGQTILTARAITNPKEREQWTSEQWRTLADASNQYVETIAPRMHFMDPDEPPTVQRIWDYAERMADRYGEPPTIFVDYLQLLAAEKGHERDSDKQVTDRNVTMLRRMAGGLNTAVWVVAALNRQSYTAPIATDSFRESSAIEYGADILLGLEPFDLETRWSNASDKTKPMVAKGMHDNVRHATKRWMDLRVLKNRFGYLPEDGLPFVYHANADTFETVWKVERAKRGGELEPMGEPMDWADDGLVM